MTADRDLLLGLFAVQLDFVSRDAFIDALNAWQFDKAAPLGDLLRDGGHLSPGRRKLLDALVDEHLQQHGGDPHKSLAALASAESVLRQSLTAIGDDDVQRTLKQVHDGPVRAAAMPGPAAGRYRILRPHAKGGLGEVFIAEDTELGRQVALKEILGRHARDASSRARFVLEAEITGGLEHPGIVPVYGLGAYPDGRPYYAMRFIKGDNLKDAIRRFHHPDASPEHQRRDEQPVAGAPGWPGFASLAFRELLGRFVDVCNAVAYAHSRGVLHRDIKPGNVMLGQFGETLLVDWGLAKVQAGPERERPDDTAETAFQPRSGIDSSVTIVGQALGTPAYMSPEQADGRIDDLGPATDVYSLGATLYELLTGQIPFSARDVHELLAAVKAGRFPPPRAVQPAVPPALEAVCLKAMALKPADRYAEALDVAKEIERFLADEPVAAYPEPAGVRLRRWTRRHARLVTGVAAACAVGLLALGVVAWQAERSRRAVTAERDVAREQKRRTRAALDAMLSEEMIERLKTQQGLTGGQREFLRAALGYYKEFAAEAATEEEGRKLVADAHTRVAILLDALGERAAAEAEYRTAAAVLESLVSVAPRNADYRRDLAAGRTNLGTALLRLGRHAEAESAYRAALADYDKLAADHPAVAAHRLALARTRNNLGALYKSVGRRAEAEAEYRAALAIRERLAADNPQNADSRRDLAASHNNLGLLLADGGRRADAAAEYRAARTIQEALVAEFPAVADYRSDLANSHHSLGVLLAGLRQWADAEAAYRAAVALRAALAEEFPAVPDYRNALASTQNNLGLLLAGLRKQPQAEAAHRAALALRQKLADDFPAVPDYRSDLAQSRINLGNLLIAAGKLDEAEAEYRAAVAVLERLAAEFPSVPVYRENLAVTHLGRGARRARAGQWAEAAAAFKPAVELLTRLAADHPDVPAHRLRLAATIPVLAEAQARFGDAAGAAATVDRLLAKGPSAGVLYDCACVLAVASAATSNSDAAAHAARAVELLRQSFVGGHRDLANTLKDADLASLRRRDDYAALMWDLADGLPR